VFGDMTGADSLAGLPTTPQREMCERNQPFRQDGKGLPAWMADSTADPDALMPVIVGLP
jgi:hypothetical protein